MIGVILFSNPHCSNGSMIPLFIDCDPGIDDALALGYALCQSDVEITGVAASGGNASSAQVADNALGWLALTGRTDISVYAGAETSLAGRAAFAEETHGPTGAGYAELPTDRTALSSTDAATAWVEAARAHPGRLIGVLLGPSTNLALALDLEPELPRLLRRLFVMGGAFNYRGNTHPTTEWNVTFDPEAAACVFAAFGQAENLPVIASLQATEAVVLTPERLARIVGAQAADVSWQAWLQQAARALRFYFEFHESDGHGYLAHIHDPFVLAAAVNWARRVEAAGVHVSADSRPEEIPWAAWASAAVDVELHGSLTRGETVADWLGRWDRPANAEVITGVDAEGFLDHLEAELTQGPK